MLNLELKKMDPAGAGVTQEVQHNGTWTDIKKGKVIHKPAGIQDAEHPGKDDWLGAYLRPAVTDPNAPEIEPGLPDGKTVYFVDDSKKDSASVEGSLQPFLTSANKKVCSLRISSSLCCTRTWALPSTARLSVQVVWMSTTFKV